MQKFMVIVGEKLPDIGAAAICHDHTGIRQATSAHKAAAQVLAEQGQTIRWHDNHRWYETSWGLVDLTEGSETYGLRVY